MTLEGMFYKEYVLDRPIHKIRLCGRRAYDITINAKTHEVIFRCQTAHRGAVGDQGIDPDHLIAFARDWIIELNKKIPCEYNDNCILKLNEALLFLEDRRKDRIKRNVEGSSKP